MGDNEQQFYLNTKGRGCGSGRKEGGVYACLPTSPFGLPWHHFFLDPPVPIPTNMEISKQGLTLFEQTIEADEANGIEAQSLYHVVDWIGASHYPDLWGFVVEMRNKGMSRRAEQLTAWADLFTESSFYILAHPKAIINGWQYHAERVRPDYVCPHHHEAHAYPDLRFSQYSEQCIGLWQYDIGEPAFGRIDWIERDITTQVGNLACVGYRPPSEIIEIDKDYRHRPGFFARFLISGMHIHVVNGQAANGKTSARKLDSLAPLADIVQFMGEVNE